MRAPIHWSLFLLLPPFLAGPAPAAEPPDAPILRVETGMHSDQILRIATDAACRILVTSSKDCSARVWDPVTGRLLRVLRPPMGFSGGTPGGRMDMARDGSVVAFAVATSLSPEGVADEACVYLFDAASGRVVGRLPGIPDWVSCLRFSPDGRHIAIGMFQRGLQVLRVADGTPVATDADYGSVVSGICFDSAGRLVTTSSDGWIRLYDAGFRKVVQRRAPESLEPRSPAFSPDGILISVCYHRVYRVDVLSGSALEPRLALQMADNIRGAWSQNAAWSRDGLFLYGGGYLGPLPHPFIRRWPNGGQGAPTDISTERVAASLVALAGGALAVASETGWEILDASGGQRCHVPSLALDNHFSVGDLLTSGDGDMVQFPTRSGKGGDVRFSVGTRALEEDAQDPAGAGLAPPRTQAPGLNVAFAADRLALLNGTSLPMRPTEAATKFAITPDGGGILLNSTHGHLRHLSSAVQVRWMVRAAGNPWKVNVAGNGRVCVAACGDGTIRWHRMSDGAEVLAFFPLGRRGDASDLHLASAPAGGARRWVLWTPSGYYDCSPGAEEFLGWHVNRGKEHEADFFPVSRFRNTYYRPGVVSRVLQTLDEAEALRLDDLASGRKPRPTAVAQMLPPVVTLLSPRDGDEVGDTPLVIRWSARAPEDAPVTGVKVLVDGRPVAAERGVHAVARLDTPGEIRVPIPARDCEVAVIAENRNAASTPALARVRWKGAAPAEDAIVKPKLYVLAVGVSAYGDPELRLTYAAKDAGDFAEALRRQEGGLYRAVDVKLLMDAGAGRGDVLDGLEWIQRQTTSRDVAAIFLSGHGINDDNGNYYFVPADFDREKVKRTGVPWSELKATVEGLAGKVLLFVDSCHSGNVMGRRKEVADTTGLINELASAENGVVVFAASTGKQTALEDAQWGNGAFTKALIEGLGGKADLFRKGKITVNTLDAYLCERVKELTGGRQTPTTAKPQTIPDFPLAVVRR